MLLWYLYASVNNKVIIGSGNDLAPVWSQVITWTNDDLLQITPLETNFSGIQIQLHTYLLSKKYIWKCHLQNVSHFVEALMNNPSMH